MIKPEQIPMEVKLRLRNILHNGETDEAVAIAAAINAWPGVENIYRSEDEKLFSVILPLPQEKNND